MFTGFQNLNHRRPDFVGIFIDQFFSVEGFKL